MRRAALRVSLRGLVVGALAALCGGCVPIGARWQNMFALLIG